MTLPRRLLGGLLLVLALCVSVGVPSAWAQNATSAPPAEETVSPEEVEKLIRTLEDPARRAELTKQLRALVEAQKTAQPEAPSVETLGSHLLNALSDGMEAASAQLAAAGKAVLDAPQAMAWVQRQIRDPGLRQTWTRLALALAVVIAAGYSARLVMLWLLGRPRTALAVRPVTGWLARLPLLAMRTVIDLLPIAAFAMAGYAALSLTDPPRAVKLAAIGFLNASILVQAVMLLTRAMLSPDGPNLRLVRVTDETAHYIAIWVRRIALTAVYGWFIAEVALLLGLQARPYTGALKLVGLAVTAMLVIVVLQNRQVVAAWLRGRDPEPTGPDPADVALAAAMGGTLSPDGTEPPPPQPPTRARDPSRALSAARRRLADVWHLLAVVYIVAIYGIWALDVAGGFRFMLRGTLITLLALAAGRLLSHAVDAVVQRGFAVAPQLAAQFPGLEGRANRYLPVFRQALKTLVWIVAGVVVLQAWGLDAFTWLSSGPGRQVGASLASIALVLLLAVVVWELVSGAIERYLTATGADGRAVERSARVRTLLPLLRNAFLIFLLAVVTLIVLSELGVNIAPLLAGAGVIGLAIGFGSQTLVKDVITGLFILLEDTINVGDVVNVGGQGGLVEGISIRTLRLRDETGTVHVIPFSDVTRVSNLTKDFSFYVFNVGVAYREDMDRVIAVLRDLGAEFQADPEWAPLVLAPLEVLGVDAFRDSAVVVKARFKTRPSKQWAVGREFNKRMKRRFDELGIEIPFPHQTVYYHNATPATGGAGPAALPHPDAAAPAAAPAMSASQRPGDGRPSSSTGYDEEQPR